MVTFWSFPASGYRNSSADFANVGTNGRGCVSSSYGAASIYGGNFNSHLTNVNPSNNCYRAEAFVVRCVQAFTNITNMNIYEKRVDASL